MVTRGVGYVAKGFATGRWVVFQKLLCSRCSFDQDMSPAESYKEYYVGKGFLPDPLQLFI